MTDDQAIEILTQRRGQMYDPLVVDAFVASLSELKSAAALDDAHAILAPKASELARSSEPLLQQTDTSVVMQALDLLACVTPFPPGQSAATVARDALSHVRRIAPFDTAAIFVLDIDSMELSPIAAEGHAEAVVRQMRIPLAERLTGWVAAYKSSVWNSDAALDIDLSFRPSELILASSIPLIHNDTVVAVLTAYGTRGQDVSMAQRRTLETLSPSVSAALSEALKRGIQGIDGRRSEVQGAAISALEAALSHSDGASSTVALVRLRPIASDQSRSLTSSASVAQYIVCGLLRPGLERHCVVLSDDTCAVYSGEPNSESALKQAFTDLMSSAQMQPYALESVTVRNSLDLQMAVRRLLRQSEPELRVRQMPRIH